MFKGLAVVVKTFGIVRSPLDKCLQCILRFREHFCPEVSYTYLTPNFISRVLIVLCQYHSEMIDGVLQATLLASNPAQLKMGVCFVRVDCYRLLEACDGFGILPAILKDHSKLIVGAGISRIYCCCFH